MYDLIHRIAYWLGLLLGPGTGTHRAGSAPRPRPVPSAAPALLPLHHSPYCRHLPLDGAASRLVRPYLTAHEQEQDRQRHRRLALVLAADFGIDLDEHVVGARKAAA
ncbi:hypothetical protein [Streptomyces sp. DH41]|uniref:hypothetical protein n=1 Tax=Streptomyces sp. DH41 TaxID=3040125 RepID=UPI002442F8FB|nr:hypothetical protein [Streptomyces sp. DH41]MDG9728109.1 hypothetical protein [Streptomyces sp. DH41]